MSNTFFIFIFVHIKHAFFGKHRSLALYIILRILINKIQHK
uniref:Uncharacterized protein n=1 Tax=Anguilla anguilla TaxID=7936 RepID=A0A0E9W8D6_ANGAN